MPVPGGTVAPTSARRPQAPVRGRVPALLRRRRADALAVAVLVGVVLVWCAPALSGASYGAFDLALRFGLDAGSLAGVHNVVNGDTARQDAVWAVLNWRAVHHGELPLWDPALLTGLPELANLQSAPLALPSLVSYLVPLRFAYDVAVAAKLVIAGTGCYAAARTLGVRRSAALLAGVVGELAGPMAAWAGWPQSGVAAWTGWLVAALLLVLEKPSGRRCVALGGVVAAIGLGGFPEVAIVLALVGLVLAAVVVLSDARAGGWARRCGAVAAGTALGVALSAPAWAPALQVLLRSVSVGRVPSILPAGELWLFVDPAYYGSPAPQGWFGPSNYYETAAFVGPAVLALVALGALGRRSDRRLWGLLGAAAVLVVLACGGAAVYRVEQALPVLGSVAFGRALLCAGELLAIAAAVGLEASSALPVRVVLGALALALVPSALVLAGGAGALSAADWAARRNGALLGCVPAVALASMLAWRAVRARRARARPAGPPGTGLALVLVVAEWVTLALASAPANSWSDRFLPESPALARAVRAAHGGLVALGGEHPAGTAVHLGVLADLNAAYGLRELAAYDGIIPRALERAWAAAAPAPDLAAAEIGRDVTSFVPPVTTRREAAALGVSDVLEPIRPSYRLVDDAGRAVAAALDAAGVHGAATHAGVLDALEWWVEHPALIGIDEPANPASLLAYLSAAASGRLAVAPPLAAIAPASAAAVARAGADPALAAALRATITAAPPSGTVEVARLGDETLRAFRGLGGVTIPAGATLRRALGYVTDATARFAVTLRHGAWVRVGITDEPGWRAASVAGTPLALRPAAGGAELAVRLPAGSSDVVLRYWPPLLSAGLVAAAVVLGVVLAVLLGGPARWRRRRGARVASRR